jgi:hypothetical protein
MSDLARDRRAAGRWRFDNPTVGRTGLAIRAIALGLISLALSAITVIARAKLWLGPQTLVLGGVGICIGAAVVLLAWQSANARGAEVLDRPLLSWRGVAVVIVACAVLAAAILYFAFALFPNSADEYGFLFQADTFRHFRLWDAPPPDPVLFDQNLVIARDGIWISQYLPVWPAVLALFEFMRLPPWLAAPACGALLLMMLWRCLRLECRSPALTVALLLVYASSGFFLLNSATYFSHCASSLIVVGSILCMLRAEHDGSWRWPVATGVCFGLALLCRIDSAAMVGIAALAAWLEQGRRGRTLALGVIGAAPLILALLAYDWLVTGDPLELPTAWAGQLSFGAHGLQGIETGPAHLRMLIQTSWRLGELADTASLVVPALYVAALAMRIRSRRLRFYDLVPPACFVLFLIYPDSGGFQMGPRYWFDGFVAMHITLGSEFSRERAEWQRFVIVCCILLVPVSLARLPGQVAFEARVMRERSSVYRLGAALPTDRRSLILVSDFFSTWDDRANRTSPNLGKDFARNGIGLDQPVLYARDDAPDALGRACRLYPGAAVFAFRLDRAHPQGWLEPLACTGEAH